MTTMLFQIEVAELADGAYVMLRPQWRAYLLSEPHQELVHASPQVAWDDLFQLLLRPLRRPRVHQADAVRYPMNMGIDAYVVKILGI